MIGAQLCRSAPCQAVEVGPRPEAASIPAAFNLIRSAQGWLGGSSFSSAAWRIKERDKWIGWSEAARAARS